MYYGNNGTGGTSLSNGKNQYLSFGGRKKKDLSAYKTMHTGRI